MATIEKIKFSPFRIRLRDSAVHYELSPYSDVNTLPQIFWRTGRPWREANLWAAERTAMKQALPRTISTNITNLLNYANFLEDGGHTWLTFPVRIADRCIYLYRGWLIKERDAGRLKPSTASEYMRNTVCFYRWVRWRGLLSSEVPLWKDKIAHVSYFTSAGFERTISRLTTDLAIPNRRPRGLRLEDGLWPVAGEDRNAILQLCKDQSSPELYRILSSGFFSGMRIGSIADLKVQTLKNAVPDPMAPGLYTLALGPSANPPVHTKFGVDGNAWMPEALLEDLIEYSESPRRSARRVKARPEDRDLVFLTSHGNPYCKRGSDRSTAINGEMARLRKAGREEGIKALIKFKFHQSRCTFATELATIAARSGDPINAIAIVKQALFHRDERTAFLYIKLASQTPAKRVMANDFTLAFLGRKNGSA